MTRLKNIPPFPEADEFRPCPSDTCDRVSRRTEYEANTLYQSIRYSCGEHQFTDHRQFDCANCGQLRQNHAFFIREGAADEIYFVCLPLVAGFTYASGKLVRWAPE